MIDSRTSSHYPGVFTRYKCGEYGAVFMNNVRSVRDRLSRDEGRKDSNWKLVTFTIGDRSWGECASRWFIMARRRCRIIDMILDGRLSNWNENRINNFQIDFNFTSSTKKKNHKTIFSLVLQKLSFHKIDDNSPPPSLLIFKPDMRQKRNQWYRVYCFSM